MRSTKNQRVSAAESNTKPRTTYSSEVPGSFSPGYIGFESCAFKTICGPGKICLVDRIKNTRDNRIMKSPIRTRDSKGRHFIAYVGSRTNHNAESLTLLIGISSDGEKWEPFEFRVSLFEKFKASLCQFPPPGADKLAIEGNELVVTYRNNWFPHDKSILPFNLDRESEWELRINIESRKATLRRLKILNYENTDQPPIYLETPKESLPSNIKL